MRQTHGTILTQHVFLGSRNSEAVCRPPAVLRTLGVLNPRKDTHLLICRLLFAVCGRAGIEKQKKRSDISVGALFSYADTKTESDKTVSEKFDFSQTIVGIETKTHAETADAIQKLLENDAAV